MAAPRFFPLALWGLPVAALLTLAGYFGPWIPHPAAGLVVTGLDLGEYVKFLVPVLSGEITIWREGFYLPLVTVSLALSLCAFRPEFAYRAPVRALLLALAAVAALNMLPPAWTPGLLRTPEFRLQSAAILLCLAALLVSPLLALLPRWLPALLIPTLSTATIVVCSVQFNRVFPAIEALYNQNLQRGWGFWLLPVGLALLAASALALLTVHTPKPNPTPAAQSPA
jgi:hypothetical protein